MKRFYVFTFLTGLFLFSAFAQEAKKLRVGLLNGPTCIPVAYLMENTSSVSAGDDRTELSFEKFADPQALLPKLIKKEIDVGFLPVNVAVKVYNSGNKSLLCAAVSGLGNLRLITTDESIKRFSDLKGKTIYMAGQGATPEYMMRYLLDENKIPYSKEGELILDYSIPTSQLAAQLISGKINYAVLPEPFSTIAKMKSDKVIYALDLQKEYLELSGSKDIYPLSVIVVRAEYAEENPELLQAFLSEYEKSLYWTVENPEKAGLLAEKAGLGLAAPIVTKAIPFSNYTYISAEAAISQIEALLKIFLKCDKKSIGGKLPDKNFYYVNNLKSEF